MIYLGVPHDGQMEADFAAPHDIALALRKIGLLQLGFRPMELTLSH